MGHRAGSFGRSPLSPHPTRPHSLVHTAVVPARSINRVNNNKPNHERARVMSCLSPTSAAAHLAWLSSRGVRLSRIKLHESHGSGLALAGGFAAAGEVILSIPAEVWKPFSAASARTSLPASVTSRIDEYADSLGAGASFSDAAILAHILSQPQHRASSPYLSDLPQPDVPLLWPAPLRAALLRGTSAGPAAESQVALSAGAHAALLGEASPPAESLAAFQWAQATLLSRGHSGEGKPLALVPGLDLLNHGGESAGAVVRFSKGNFQLVAMRR